MTPLSQAFQTLSWVIPAAQTVHILGIAATMAAAVMVNLRVLGLLARDQPVAQVSARFTPVIWRALPVLLVTGIVLIVAEPVRSLKNPAFALKMALLVIAIAVTRIGQRRVAGTLRASVSLMLWAGIVFAGRWIAYIQVR